MQILHPFAGSVQQYTEQLADPDSHRPGHCPQCHTKHPLTAHGFYTRTLVDTAFDGVIRVRPYWCQACPPACAVTCWAGPAVWLPTAAAPHSPPPPRPPEPPHTPFAWNREAFLLTL